MSSVVAAAERKKPSIIEEFLGCWHRLPYKGIFFTLLALWAAVFHFYGNSVLGFADTPSIFGWLGYNYHYWPDDSHGRLIPFVVLGFLWWKREQLLALPSRHWWPALGLLVLAALLWLVGFNVQQTQISVVGFFLGLYALIGVTWGPQWMKATFFPMFLFAFAVPITNVSNIISFPMRLFATHITGLVCQWGLSIDVIRDGTRIFDSQGSYQYEVAAACSGIRSLTATLAIAAVMAFVSFRSPWRRLLMVASAFPLAVLANVIRLTSIIVAAEAFGQRAGDGVHENTWLSLVPYIVAIGGVMGVRYLLSEDRKRKKAPVQPAPAFAVAESSSGS
jgi:exosortase